MLPNVCMWYIVLVLGRHTLECMIDVDGGFPFLVYQTFLTTRDYTSLGHNVPSFAHGEGEGGHQYLRHMFLNTIYSTLLQVVSIRGEFVSNPFFKTFITVLTLLATPVYDI